MEESTVLLCGSERNLYGKQIMCDRPYRHSVKELHRAIATGKVVHWDGAPSADIIPRKMVV